ncbi:class I SAM-dependent methyltransferase [Streptomyces sp. NPDC058989]|uniref:class I SAM-dependent methyltransferase n=1 Tax=Streptomyces sp. NPDC058989 TaxID=3346686 RepID=UPI0036D2071A
MQREEPSASTLQGRPIKPAVWDAWAREGRRPFDIGVEEMRFLVHHTSDRYGQIAVDAGCGIGRFSRRLRRLGYHVTGVDYSVLSLQLARAEGYGPHLRYLHADLEDGVPSGLPLHGVDLVVARTVVPFLTKPVEWLQQVRDLWLTPAGQVYLVVPIGREQQPLQTGQMTRADLETLCSGWQVERRDTGGLAQIILRPRTP